MPAMGFDHVSRTHVGCRRKLNEDAFLADADRRLWAVADGMGGHDAGEVASAAVIDAIACCKAQGAIAEVATALAVALKDANDRLIVLGRSGEDQRTIGSTVVVLLANGDEYACLWAGDSRAYRLRGTTMEQITRDHSLVQELVDAGMLEASEADGHPNANIITRAVGAAEILDVDRVTGDLRSGDVFLLASDGVTRLLTPAELAQEIDRSDLAAAADRLIEMVLARGAPDNATLILLRAV